MFGGLLRLIIECDPETESDALLLATQNPLALSILFSVYQEGAWSNKSEEGALARVPRTAAAETFVRMNGPKPKGADMWTVGLIRGITNVDPEFAWESEVPGWPILYSK
jgi:hypothetical protein